MSSLAAFFVVMSTALGQPEAEQPAVPEEIVEELQHLEGVWTATGEVGGLPLKGRWMARMAPGGHCVSINYRLTLGERAIRGTGVTGWDTVSNELFTVVFFSNGVVEVIREKRVSPGVFEGVYKGSAEEKSFEAKCTSRRKGSSEWTFTTTGMTLGGEKEEDLSVRFVRAAEKKKAPK